LYENCENNGSYHSKHIWKLRRPYMDIYISVMESGCALVKKFGTAPKQNLTES